MTIDAFIETTSEKLLQAADVEAVAASLGVSVVELFDSFARRVAQRYLRGELSYTMGDMAMNAIFGYATAGGGPQLSRLAWQVFEAFDQGEYVHAGEPVEEQGEAKTRMLLGRIAELRDA